MICYIVISSEVADRVEKSFSLFGNYNISRIVVTVASDERSVGECPERSALVLALLVGQEGWIIDTSIVTFLMELTQAE